MILSGKKKKEERKKQIMAKNSLGVPMGKGEVVRWMGIWGVFWMQTVIFVMDGQWNPTVQHREMCVIRLLSCTAELDETL